MESDLSIHCFGDSYRPCRNSSGMGTSGKEAGPVKVFASILAASESCQNNGDTVMKGSFNNDCPGVDELRESRPGMEQLGLTGSCASRTVQPGDWQKYRDDQLLSNPGGDRYCLDEKRILTESENGGSFLSAISKDISDAFSNVKNFFKNALFGSKRLYRDNENRIKETKVRGLVGSVCDFFKDVGSAMSFGCWRPDGEPEPENFSGRLTFMFSKMKEALFGDVVQGVGGSTVNLAEDLVLAGWNLAEVLPDATIGNFEKGREVTTAIFDNGQVVIDYLTDIVPTGEAWLRVHASKWNGPGGVELPVIYNLKMPEHYSADLRWSCVRNTPLRKTIETIGSLAADALATHFADVRVLGEERRERN